VPFSKLRTARSRLHRIMLGVVAGTLSLSNARIAAQNDVIFVSILPQAYFVERIIEPRHGECKTQEKPLWHVEVMVRSGQSPETYEPTPKQMASLAEAKIYFAIGVPFEQVWIDRIKANNPNLKIVDTREGIQIRRKDPHIWLDPILVKTQARTIAEALMEIDPAHTADYQSNLEEFLVDLDKINREITKILEGMENRFFLVFHPAWGYFAERYGLRQLAVEVEGKEPSPRGLAAFIEQSKALIDAGQTGKTIFVQKQFSTKSAEVVAQAIGARVIMLDPLARDYLCNLRRTAQILVAECAVLSLRCPELVEGSKGGVRNTANCPLGTAHCELPDANLGHTLGATRSSRARQVAPPCGE